MLKIGAAAALAVMMSLSGPAEACGWKRDGIGWRSAGDGYSFRDRRAWRSERMWRGDGYGWRSERRERRGLFGMRRVEPDAEVVTK